MKGLYKSGLKGFIDGQIDMQNDSILVTLIRRDLYRASFENDTVLADIPLEARIQSLTLTGVRVETGAVYVDNFKFTEVGDWENPIEGELVVWKDGGDEARSPLIGYIGKSGEQFGFGMNYDPFPLRLIGGDILVDWGRSPIIYLPRWGEDEEEEWTAGM